MLICTQAMTQAHSNYFGKIGTFNFPLTQPRSSKFSSRNLTFNNLKFSAVELVFCIIKLNFID